MSVAHDLDLLAEQRRKETARKLVAEAAHDLYQFRRRTAALEGGDHATWADARLLAQGLIRAAAPLDLGLLVACAKEVLLFAEKRVDGEAVSPDLTLYLLSALDTLGMELERLRHDRDLR